MALASIAERFLGLHGWVALLAVFALPALEASAFVGFFFPGEIAVLLGGVLASQGRIPLAAAIAAAVSGAVIGDSIGYEVGKRYGRRLLQGTVGRIVRVDRWQRAERYLAERGGAAVFFGRFTAALRVLVPGLAGMSGMRYRTFLLANAAGAAVWGGGFVVAGYLAGNGWRRVERVAGRAGLVLALLAVVAGLVVLAARWAADHQERLAPVLDRVRRRLPGGRWSLVTGLAVLALAGWAFGLLVRTVVVGGDAARLDRPVLDWFVAHREPWLTTVMRAVTFVGSSATVVPVLAVTAVVLWRRRGSLRPALFLAVTYAGAEVLFQVVKLLTARPRPPASLAAAPAYGFAFPSGHATLSVAAWGAVAVATGAGRSWPRQVAGLAAVALLAGVIGVSRLYLGVHWLTDVLGGWALGTAWLALSAVVLARSGPVRRRERARAPA